jgi:hypothetical protein
MGKGGNPAIPYPNQPRAASFTAPSRYPAQYSSPFQQQFAPQQQRFSMPPPPQRSYPQQQQQYNLAGIMGARNLGQQQQQQFYQPQPQIPPELQQLREANMRAYQQQVPQAQPNGQAQQAQQYQAALRNQGPQQMGGKGSRMSMDMPQRPSPVGGKGASQD